MLANPTAAAVEAAVAARSLAASVASVATAATEAPVAASALDTDFDVHLAACGAGHRHLNAVR